MDYATSNFSHLFLTKKRLLSDWLEFNDNKQSTGSDIVLSPLTLIIDAVPYRLVGGEDGKAVVVYHDQTDASVLTIHVVDEHSLEVYYDDENGKRLYLTPDTSEATTDALPLLDVRFEPQSFAWRYTDISTGDNPDRYEIYTVAGSNKYALGCPTAGITNESNNEVCAVYVPPVFDSVSGHFADGVGTPCTFRRDFFNKKRVFNTSWVAYDQSANISFINTDASLFDIPIQHVVHTEYNGEGVNFIPLKNNLSYRGHSVRGDYYTEGTETDFRLPNVNFRTYTSINEAGNQEYGSSDLTLNYTFHTFEVEVPAGGQVTFTIPKPEENYGVSPLSYPAYEKHGFPININATRFVENGAFASDIPAFADKFRRMQGPNSDFFELNPRKEDVHNDVHQQYRVSNIHILHPRRIPVWSTDYFLWEREFSTWFVEETSVNRNFGGFFMEWDDDVESSYIVASSWLYANRRFSTKAWSSDLGGDGDAKQYAEYVAKLRYLYYDLSDEEFVSRFLGTPIPPVLLYDYRKKSVELFSYNLHEEDIKRDPERRLGEGVSETFVLALETLAAKVAEKAREILGEEFNEQYHPEKGDIITFDFEKWYNPAAPVVNGTYLCTWLYTPSLDSTERPRWMDRFYYPDLVSRQKALAAGATTHYDPSYENVVDRNFLPDSEVYKGLVERSYYDLDSTMIIEDSNTYRYDRLSKEMVKEVLEGISEYRVTEAKAANGDTVDVATDMSFDNRTWMRVESSSAKPVTELNLNFDLVINPKKSYGIRLLGNDAYEGLTIDNRKDLAPYHYFVTESSVIMLNNRIEAKRELNISAKYPGERIVDYRLGEVLGNLMVVTEKTVEVGEYKVSHQYVYILSFDLKIISRFSYENPDLKAETIVEQANERDFVVTDNGTFQHCFGVVSENEDDEATLAALELDISTYYYDPEQKHYRMSFDALFSSGSVFHKNNLYVPHVAAVGDRVVKLVFTPDNDDESALVERYYDEHAPLAGFNYVAYLRVLRDNNRSSDPECYIAVRQYEQDTNFQRHVKSIYVDAEDRVYGVQFD